MPGTLFIVPTPIGNLEDISQRALRILREVDLIGCEDTRHSARLLRHFDVSTPRRSYHEHNEAMRSRQFLQLLEAGQSIALISDAGTPLVSDPGRRLVQACIEAGIEVVPLPGPVAAITALAGSGLPTDSFLFAGFLPPKRKARRDRLAELAALPFTLIFYEAPHRLLFSLEDMASILGPRRACLARELTKVHEEWIRDGLAQIAARMKERGSVKGEVTLVVEPPSRTLGNAVYPDSIQRHLEEEQQRTGEPRNQALKRVAEQRGISRREAYRRLLEEG